MTPGLLGQQTYELFDFWTFLGYIRHRIQATQKNTQGEVLAMLDDPDHIPKHLPRLLLLLEASIMELLSKRGCDA